MWDQAVYLASLVWHLHRRSVECTVSLRLASTQHVLCCVPVVATTTAHVQVFLGAVSQLQCAVTASSTTTLTCTMPAIPGACDDLVLATSLAAQQTPQALSFTFVINGVSTSIAYTATPTLTPVLTSLAPQVASVARTTVVTITFTTPTAVTSLSPPAVTFGTRACNVSSYAPPAVPGGVGTLSCTLPRRQPQSGDLSTIDPPVVVFPDLGAADPQGFTLDARLFVSGVSPARGSLLGGVQVTVAGAGFGVDTAYVSVVLVDPTDSSNVLATCAVVAVSDGAIACTVGMVSDFTDTTVATVEVSVLSHAGDVTTGEWGIVTAIGGRRRRRCNCAVDHAFEKLGVVCACVHRV